MASFEEQIQKACDERIIPGVVLLATDAEGKFQYQKAFGPKDPNQPMGLDSTFILASCTKLMTSIAALQCVERGQIGLDDDVSEILPELEEPEILEGYEDGSEKPILKTAREKITLRLLLTHASGIAYDAIHPNLVRWRTLRGQEPGIGSLPMMDRISVPLVFEPGSGWIYGTGLDWAGVLISRLNHTSLEAYMQQHIWNAVGAKDITFHQELKPSVKQNLVKMSMRGNIEKPAFQLAVKSENGVEWTDDLLYDDPTEDEYGGSGAIGSPVEYLKIMHSILANDGRLLKPGTVEDMFKPQLGKESLQALIGFREQPMWIDTFASLPLGTKIDYGLGGLLILNDLKTGLKKGSLTWSGLPNLLWTIDRDSGLALLYASNILPFGDFQSATYQKLFEKEMYDRYTAQS